MATADPSTSMSLAPALSVWGSIGVAALSALGAALPAIIGSLGGLSAASRYQLREKARLENLRLRYEIEAFRKEKGLDEIAGSTVNDREPHSTHLFDELSARERFGYAVLGSLLVTLLSFVGHFAAQINDITLTFLIIYLVRAVVYGLFAGIVSLLILPVNSPQWSAVLVGVATNALISQFVWAIVKA
jgi:hypothetical protein